MKHRLLRALMPFGVYPHINFTYSPFKILEYEAMLDWLPPAGSGTALDIGCGDGLHTMLLGRRFSRTCGIDVNERFIGIARDHARAYGRRANLEFFAQPLEAIGFAPATFDVVLSVCVLEHIPNHEEVLRECLRIMKPGARIVFSVDTLQTIDDPALVESHRRQHHVVRYFREDTLRELLEQREEFVRVLGLMRLALRSDVQQQADRRRAAIVLDRAAVGLDRDPRTVAPHAGERQLGDAVLARDDAPADVANALAVFRRHHGVRRHAADHLLGRVVAEHRGETRIHESQLVVHLHKHADQRLFHQRAKALLRVLAERVMHRFGDRRLLRLVKAGPDRLQAGAEQGGNEAFNQFVLSPELFDIRQVAQQILQIRHVEACQRVFQFDLHDRSLEKSSHVLQQNVTRLQRLSVPIILSPAQPAGY